jgi:hypothetical protein
MNSSNSSMPPSSDRPEQTPPKVEKTSTAKKRGEQAGHVKRVTVHSRVTKRGASRRGGEPPQPPTGSPRRSLRFAATPRRQRHRRPRRACPVGAQGSQLTHAANATAAPDGLAPSELKVHSYTAAPTPPPSPTGSRGSRRTFAGRQGGDQLRLWCLSSQQLLRAATELLCHSADLASPLLPSPQ